MKDPVGIKEIAERLGVKENTVSQWKRRGKLPEPMPFKVSHNDVWEWSDVNTWATTAGHPVRHHVVVNDYSAIREYGDAIGASKDEAEKAASHFVNDTAGKIRWLRLPCVVTDPDGHFGWYGVGEELSEALSA